MTSRAPSDPDPAGLAARLAGTLPAADVEALAAATVGGADDLRRLRARSGSSVLRGACDDLLALLPLTDTSFVAGALLGAARSASRYGTAGADVVWTGPTSPVTTTRLTSAVVIELIDSAIEDLLLVSFATRPEPSIRAALDRAIQRKVAVTFLLERSVDNLRYSGDGDPYPGLYARRLTWPAQHRQPGAAMHAKIIVVDRRLALVGSANLTGRAMDANLECGVLLRGDDQPGRIRDHIIGLVQRGHLVGE